MYRWLVHRQRKLIKLNFLSEQLFALSQVFAATQQNELRHAQANNGECNLPMEYCTKSWRGQSRMPLHVMKYAQHRGDVSVCEGLLLKGVCIVVPLTLQGSILGLIPDVHQGINRRKTVAQESLWWPGVNSHIEMLVSTAPSVLKHASNAQSQWCLLIH